MKRFIKMHKNIRLSLISLLAVMTLVGCQSTSKPTIGNDAKAALDEAISLPKGEKTTPPVTVPLAIQQELLQQQMTKAKDSLLAEKRLDISANQINAGDFFSALVEDSEFSVAVHPDVTGKLTLNLKQVTVAEALNIVQNLYGYDVKYSGNVIQVFPAGMRTETIPLDYLFIKRFGVSSTSINSGGVSENDPQNSGNGGGNSNNFNNQNNRNSGNNNQNSNSNNNQNGRSGINIYTENESDFWQELKLTLESLVGTEAGRSVIVSPQAGLITVRALPIEIDAVKKFIQDSQTHLRRQVIIEAKILEVTLNDDFQQGIRWDQVLGHIGNTDLSFSTTGRVAGNSISAAVGGVSSLAFRGSDFSGVINLLKTQGNVQVLSSPRITATNNQKAVFKVGEDEYFVTNVSSTTTTGTATTTTPEIDLTPFFSGIALDVTPQINASGEVILHVHPSVTVTDEQQKTITLNQEDFVLPLAQSSVRESDTIVRAQSGEIVVIGGLTETRKVDSESKTPLLGDIPFLGELFTSKSEVSQKKELVIMLKPTVVGNDTWQDQLKEARALLQRWFPNSE